MKRHYEKPKPEIKSSSDIIRRCINGYYSIKHKDPAPTQRPYMCEGAIRDKCDIVAQCRSYGTPRRDL
jgi:hypothetical protein